MKNQLSRGEFIKLGSLTMLGALASDFTYASTHFFHDKTTKLDVELMKRLLLQNDLKVRNLLDADPISQNIRLSSFRGIGSDVSIMSASLSNTASKYYKSIVLAERLNQSIDALLKKQYNDGTLDAGGNRQSPPDTAFILEYTCAAAAVLIHGENKDLEFLRDKIKKFILNAGEAMITGGVHTPNHRWVVSAALATINSLYPDSRYVRRIDEWLAEGVYLNEDGHYLERSGIYSAVINNAFITMARLLDRPELLEFVTRNLTTYYYYTETNGEVVSVDSRRQDQFMTLTVTKFYLQYRFMAIHTNNPMFANMVKAIEKLPDFTSTVLSNYLVFFMENEELQKEISAKAKVANDFEKFFAMSNLARIRRGKASITLFGGNDKPLLIVSGRSSNPNFLMYRKGDAVLKYMRLSTSFFRMGYFSSDGMKKEGNKYILEETKEADYYQPLTAEYRKADGDYKLSPSLDGRFWNKMDFESRATSNVKKQHTIIEVIENNGTLDLDFKVDGPPNVEVTIEMCFNEGSLFNGAEMDERGNYFLKSDFGKLSMGTDVIKIGPGKIEHQNIDNLESEEYTYHQGNLRTDGVHVYITGFTPFHHKMTIS